MRGIYDCYITNITVIWLLYNIYNCYMTVVKQLYDSYITVIYNCYITVIYCYITYITVI